MPGEKPMKNMPDGIVTVHLDNERYRGAYYIKDGKMHVTAYGLRQGSIDLGVLGDERGKAALNLAKLVLIDMVKSAMATPINEPQLCLQGSTTAIFY
jgi:hypothetical protein